MLIKAEVGGWDTHFAQGASTGLMANLMQDLTVVTMSEFGRRASENGSLGTDHGHGSMMMVLGGNVEGGKVHGDWPGMREDQLMGPGDLAVTTDYRDVLSEILVTRLNNSATDAIFPNYQARVLHILK